MAVPNKPDQLRTEVISNSALNLYWRDNSYDETRFEIWRKRVSGGLPGSIDPGQIIARVLPNVTFYQSIQLRSSATYWYQVRAVNLDGPSDWSDIAVGITHILPLDAPPLAPINLSVEVIADEFADIQWQTISNNEDGYIVEFSIDGTNFIEHGTTQDPTQFPLYRAHRLTSSVQYWMRVRAYNRRGSSGPSNVVTFTTTAFIGLPAAPTNLIITEVTHNAIKLRFQDNASNETKFLLQVSTTAGASWGNLIFLGINEIEYQHTSLPVSTAHLYRVRAENDGGESDWSNTAGATTLATPTVPAAPTNLRVTDIAEFNAVIEWNDNSNNEDRFYVEVSTDGGPFVNWDPQTIHLGANTLFFIVRGLETFIHVYSFRVRAGNSAGFSAYSNVVITTILSLYKSYLTDPMVTDNKAYIITPAETGNYVLTGPVGEVGSARWAFLTDGIRAAYQIPPITETLGVPGDGVWRARNEILSGIIEAVPVGTRTRYTLTLNTFNDGVYACDEVNLFLCAVSPLPDVTVNEPGIIPFTEQEPLGSMSNLVLRWTQGVITASQGSRCGNGLDVAISFISIYFKNTANNQTLQYQIYTYDSRNYQPSGTWFNSTGPFFGVADSIHQYGGSYLGIGQAAAAFETQILARVSALMSACPNPALDDDLGNWKITLLSAGPFTNGEASITSTIEQIFLEVRLNAIDQDDVSITSIAPRTGPLAGGTAVSIVGIGFVPGTTVSIGGVAATSVVWVRSTLLTAVTGAHTSGTGNVVVTLPSSQSATLVGGFTYTDAPGTGDCDIPDGTVCWQVAGPLITVPSGSFVTAASVATIIDTRWEFTATTTGTALMTNSQVQVPFWQRKHLYWPGDSVRPTDTTIELRAVVMSAVWDEKKKTQDVPSGTSGNNEPTWPAEGERIEDNEVEWVMVKDHWYKDGVLKFTTGDNAELAKQFEVLLYEVTGSSARFRLVLPTPYPIQVGDDFIVEAGCDKTVPTCTYKFDNILNFGGEPHVAGFNRSHDTPTDENLQS